MLDELYTVGGVTKSAREFCDENGLPYEVFEYRKKTKKLQGSFLFMSSDNITYYRGKAFTLEMIAEYTGVEYGTIKNRWRRGDRGKELFKAEASRDVQDPREKLVFQCRDHLRMLVRAHRDRAVSILKGKTRGVVEEPFDAAAALLNAKRFEEAARGNLARSTGYTWDHAA